MTPEKLLKEYRKGARDFSGANLRGADLPAPTVVLLASWGVVSKTLCRQLMRYDAANCPAGNRLFYEWAKGGPCPYNKLKIQRCANFSEYPDWWSPGNPPSAFRLMVSLIREKCKDSDYHRDKDRAKWK